MIYDDDIMDNGERPGFISLAIERASPDCFYKFRGNEPLFKYETDQNDLIQPISKANRKYLSAYHYQTTKSLVQKSD